MSKLSVQEEGNTYMYIQALSDGLSVSFSRNNIEYSIDNIDNWEILESDNQSPIINKGQKIYFRAFNLTAEDNWGIGTFQINKRCNIGGNAMSLLFGDDYLNKYSLQNKRYAFAYLFRECALIEKVSSSFLPATTLSDECYAFMFDGCTRLEKAPDLPATTLEDGCYYGMFFNCFNLKYIKALFTESPGKFDLNFWVRNVFPTGTFVKSKDATWDTTPGALGYDGVPAGWTVVNDGEENGGGEVKLISFTIVEGIFNTIEVEYNAIEGMTWVEWVDSEYNTGGYYIYEKYVLTPDRISVTHSDTGRDVLTDEVIISKKYTWG